MKIDSILIYVTFSKAYVVYQIDCFDGGVVRLCTLDWVFIGGTWHDWGVHSPSGTRFSVAKVNFKIPCISGNWSGMKEKVNLLHTPTKVKDRCCCHTIFFWQDGKVLINLSKKSDTNNHSPLFKGFHTFFLFIFSLSRQGFILCSWPSHGLLITWSMPPALPWGSPSLSVNGVRACEIP